MLQYEEVEWLIIELSGDLIAFPLQMIAIGAVKHNEINIFKIITLTMDVTFSTVVVIIIEIVTNDKLNT